MKKYLIDTENKNYKIPITTGEPPQILPSSDSVFFDTNQTYESGYPSYVIPDSEIIATYEVSKDDLPENPSVFNFDKLSSNFSEGELLEDPLGFTDPYIHYMPLTVKENNKIKTKWVYIDYLADYEIATFVPNQYAKYSIKPFIVIE
jgi:hypothetical protein